MTKTKLKATSFRLDAETNKLITQLAARFKVGRVDVLRLALRALAKSEGLS